MNKDALDIIEAINIIVEKKMNNVAKIDKAICIGNISGNKCAIQYNGVTNTVTFYGNAPIANTIYPLFIPGGNMSVAFIINPN